MAGFLFDQMINILAANKVSTQTIEHFESDDLNQYLILSVLPVKIQKFLLNLKVVLGPMDFCSKVFKYPNTENSLIDFDHFSKAKV
jgi:hypothetical protein